MELVSTTGMITDIEGGEGLDNSILEPESVLEPVCGLGMISVRDITIPSSEVVECGDGVNVVDTGIEGADFEDNDVRDDITCLVVGSSSISSSVSSLRGRFISAVVEVEGVVVDLLVGSDDEGTTGAAFIAASSLFVVFNLFLRFSSVFFVVGD
jgi:hypothetical protein